MAKKTQRVERFEHDGRRVVVWIEELPDDITFTLNRYLSDTARAAGRYDEGMAQLGVLGAGISKIKIYDDTYVLTKGKRVPRYYDDEVGKTVLEHSLGYVIRHNRFLVEEERFSEAFEEYVLGEDQDGDGDDEDEGASAKGSTRTLGLASDPT